ncbi:GmrSD restriction endonuclease domain-containing protein [Paracoccus rhizosphaerae]|uniref:GmrSD restriction endonuclease domain-containing protein n=1 Tax=Paracoccus rhizosphaerae TaxID=1133347 RepID=UPI00360A8E83
MTATHKNYSTLINNIENGEVKIPQFQRDFVWTIQRSAALLDSVIKGYPIGTFIFWVTKDSLRSVKEIGGASLPAAKKGESVAYVLG